MAGIDLLPEELVAIQPELRYTIILVAILFGLLNILMDIYRKLSRFRGARKFWIKHLTRADQNFEFAASNFNWFVLTPAGLHLGLLVLSYLILSVSLFVLFYFEYYVAFLVVLVGALFVAIMSYYMHRKIESTISLKFSVALIKKLRKQVKYSLILRYLSYGIILLALSLAPLIDWARGIYAQEEYIITVVLVVIVLILAFSIMVSRKSQRIAVDYLRKGLNQHYVSKPDVTVFTDAEFGKISGKLIDIFDRSVLTLEDASKQKFLIPWKSIDFLAVKSAYSGNSEEKEGAAKPSD